MLVLADSLDMTPIQMDNNEYPKDAQFFWDTVVFKVEDTLFKVPIYHFLESSETFAVEYKLYEIDSDPLKSQLPVGLNDVGAVDFRNFLKVLYPRDIFESLSSAFTAEEWISTLKLSALWDFTKYKALAIQHLSSAGLSTIDKLCLGKEYDVAEWVLPSYEKFIKREKPMSMTDAERMGFHIAVRILLFREKRLVSGTCPSRGEVATAFGLELGGHNDEPPAVEDKEPEVVEVEAELEDKHEVADFLMNEEPTTTNEVNKEPNTTVINDHRAADREGGELDHEERYGSSAELGSEEKVDEDGKNKGTGEILESLAEQAQGSDSQRPEPTPVVKEGAQSSAIPISQPDSALLDILVHQEQLAKEEAREKEALKEAKNEKRRLKKQRKEERKKDPVYQEKRKIRLEAKKAKKAKKLAEAQAANTGAQM